MAEEINLRAYIERIETMIRQGRMDEAIAHSAHILQFYPKNAVVYRNMGRALMRLQRYEEASEIFRRLLAAIPDDFSAHYQLSIVYENDNKAEAAIWHIERAFDQQPNNAQVNDRLRELYKKFKQVDVDKIQLTAGAVAIQYSKAGMYSEAISLLQRTLVKVPDRADLLTVLANTQWERGDALDAAETSLDLLKSYPYALDANRILSELWLQEQRPSDAQRYLSRVEDIDPYLAYEIAIEDAVPDEQFMVEELDFSKYAASLASQEQAPDWLSNIEELTESEQNALQSNTLDDFDSDDNIAVADDNEWLNELHEDSQPIMPVKKKVTDDLSGLLPDDFNFPDSAGTDDTVDEDELSNFDLLDMAEGNDDFDGFFDDLDDIDSTGLTGLLGEEDDEGTGLTGLLGEDNSSPVARASGLTGMLGLLDMADDDAGNPQPDDLDWLEEVSSGNYHAEDLNPDNEILAEDDDFLAEMADDKDEALAWLDTDDLINNNSNPSDEMSTDNLEQDVNIDPNDPMAWLQDSGIDFDEDAEDKAGFFIEDDPVTIESNKASPMAWLQDEGVELDDAVSESTDNLDLDDSMAWFQDEGVELDGAPEFFEAVDTNEILTGQLASLDDAPEIDGDPMAWLEDGGVEFLDDETSNDNSDDDWLADDSVLDDLLNIADLNNSEHSNAIADDDLFIDTEMQDTMNDQPDWTADDDFNSDDGLDWLDNGEADSQDNLEADDDSMAWLAEEDGVLDNSEDDSMAWLAEEDGILDNNDDDSMAWLAEEDGILDNNDDDSMAWLAEEDGVLDDDEDFIIEAEEKVLDEALPQAKAGTSLLNFLNDDHSDLDIDTSLDEISEDETFEDEGLDWLNALDGDDGEENETFEPDSFADDFESVETNDTDWANDEVEDNNLNWGEDAGQEELDWTVEQSTEDEDFFPDFEGNNELSEDEAIAEPASEDWLAELGDNDMTDEPQDGDWAVGDSFTDELGDEDELAEPAEADWLNELDDDSDDFDSLEDDNELAEPTEADWLNELDDDSDDFDSLEDDNELAEPAEADWLNELDDDSDDFDSLEDDNELAEPVEADWLNELDDDSDDFDSLEDDNELAEPAEAGWLNELDDDSDDFDSLEDDNELAEPVEADWLNELDDDSDDFDSLEDDNELAEPVEADWLNELDDDSDDFDSLEDDNELAEPVEADWLNELDDDSDDFDSLEDDNELAEPAEAGWLNELDDDSDDFDSLEDDNELAEPVEADWLNELDDDSDDFDSLEDDNELAEPAEAGWLNELDDDSDDFDSLEDDNELAEPVEADWLNELDDDSDDFDSLEDDNELAEPAEAGWLNELDDDSDDMRQDDIQTDDLDIEDSPVAEEDDNWLSEVGVQEEDNWTDEDYSSEFADDYDLNVSTKGMSDMLDTIRSSRENDDYASTLDDIDADEPEWLKHADEHLNPEQNQEVDWGDDEDAGFEDEAIPLAEFEVELEEDLFEASASSSDYQDDYEEELEQADADNAPDWLNAMVPGLDLDFEAEDEGYLDEGFDERENTLRERRINESETIKSDFNWLQDIVEEETGLMDAIDDDDDIVTTRPPERIVAPKRYEFSEPPVWARDGNATDSIAQAVAMSNETPDYLSDFDDFDEPSDYDLDEAFDDEFNFESEEIDTVDELEEDLNDAFDNEFGFEDEEVEDNFADFDEESNIGDNDSEFAIGDERFDFDDIDDILDDEFDDEFDD